MATSDVDADPSIDPEEWMKEWIEKGWPWPLIKALRDPFTYALMLKGGQVIYFREATVNDDYGMFVTLLLDREHRELTRESFRTWGNPTFECGICVRVTDIVWVAYAPYGS